MYHLCVMCPLSLTDLSFLYFKSCEQRQSEDTMGQNKGFWVILYFHFELYQAKTKKKRQKSKSYYIKVT